MEELTLRLRELEEGTENSRIEELTTQLKQVEEEKIQAKNPLFCEVLPLTLEEIFISETEVAGYEVKNLFQ